MNASVTRKSGRHGRVVAISEWSPLQVLLYTDTDSVRAQSDRFTKIIHEHRPT